MQPVIENFEVFEDTYQLVYPFNVEEMDTSEGSLSVTPLTDYAVVAEYKESHPHAVWSIMAEVVDTEDDEDDAEDSEDESEDEDTDSEESSEEGYIRCLVKPILDQDAIGFLIIDDVDIEEDADEVWYSIDIVGR